MTVTDSAHCPRCGADLRPAEIRPDLGAAVPPSPGFGGPAEARSAKEGRRPAAIRDLCPACLFTAALSVEEEPCPYQVLAPMSEGSNRVTYLAQALSGTRGLVALELYGPRDDVDEVLARYQRWRPALERVRHPSAARLLAAGRTAEGRLYVASEYVAGWPLTALDSHASVGVTTRAELARQLTGAVAAAHAAGVVHLRLDAARVKVSTAGGPRATILGFGSSLIVDGAGGPPEVDLMALAAIIGKLGIESR